MFRCSCKNPIIIMIILDRIWNKYIFIWLQINCAVLLKAKTNSRHVFCCLKNVLIIWNIFSVILKWIKYELLYDLNELNYTVKKATDIWRSKPLLFAQVCFVVFVFFYLFFFGKFNGVHWLKHCIVLIKGGKHFIPIK